MSNREAPCYQNLRQFELPPGFRGRGSLIVQLWWIVESLFVKRSPQFCYGWRRFWLRLFGARIGRGVLIRPTVTVTYPWKVSIGDYSWIGDDVCIYSLGKISIGRNVVVSQKSYLCAGDHDYSDPNFAIRNPPVVIDDEVWICTDSFVAPGVVIGRGAVIGARSTVTKSLPAGMICLGTPCKPVKERIPGVRAGTV